MSLLLLFRPHASASAALAASPDYIVRAHAVHGVVHVAPEVSGVKVGELVRGVNVPAVVSRVQLKGDVSS